MGRLKEEACGDFSTFASTSNGGDRGRWRDAQKCPVCGHRGFCQIARDGGTVLCKRVSSGVDRDGKLGGYSVHHLDGFTARRLHDEVASSVQQVSRASADTRDEVYRAVLARLSLDTKHRLALDARGFSAEQIAAGGYASLPLQGRAQIARELIEAGHSLEGVPGFHIVSGSGRTWWSVSGPPGLLVPLHSIAGRIVALKVRPDWDGLAPLDEHGEPTKRPKYLALSSRAKGGPPAENAAHFPVFATRAKGLDLWVTEGELKADAASVLAGANVLSIPGVGAWRLALDAALELLPSRVVVALDADGATNPAVAAATHGLLRALRAAGVSSHWFRWDLREGKGFDDYLLNRQRSTGLEIAR